MLNVETAQNIPNRFDEDSMIEIELISGSQISNRCGLTTIKLSVTMISSDNIIRNGFIPSAATQVGFSHERCGSLMKRGEWVSV